MRVAAPELIACGSPQAVSGTEFLAAQGYRASPVVTVPMPPGYTVTACVVFRSEDAPTGTAPFALLVEVPGRRIGALIGVEREELLATLGSLPAILEGLRGRDLHSLREGSRVVCNPRMMNRATRRKLQRSRR